MPSNDTLITPEEIKTLRDGAKTITLTSIIDAHNQGNVIQVVPVKLKSGYLVSMSFDRLDERTAEHISVSNPDSRTDPADAEIIAKAVLGDIYTMMKSILNKNAIHFIKIVGD